MKVNMSEAVGLSLCGPVVVIFGAGFAAYSIMRAFGNFWQLLK